MFTVVVAENCPPSRLTVPSESSPTKSVPPENVPPVMVSVPGMSPPPIPLLPKVTTGEVTVTAWSRYGCWPATGTPKVQVEAWFQSPSWTVRLIGPPREATEGVENRAVAKAAASKRRVIEEMIFIAEALPKRIE